MSWQVGAFQRPVSQPSTTTHRLYNDYIAFIFIIIHYINPGPIGAVGTVERCGSQSEGPGFKSRRRRWDSSVRQAANGPCLSRLSCINEYKVFLRCLPVYGGTTLATIRWWNGASPEVLRKKHISPKGLLKKLHRFCHPRLVVTEEMGANQNFLATTHVIYSINNTPQDHWWGEGGQQLLRHVLHNFMFFLMHLALRLGQAYLLLLWECGVHCSSLLVAWLH